LAIGEIEDGENLLARDGRVEFYEFVNGFAAFEKIDQTLNRHPRASEAWCAAHALRAYPDCLIQSALLFGCHNSKVGDPGSRYNSEKCSNGLMAVTRRSLARVLAAAAAVSRTGVSQTNQPASNADLESARNQMRTNIEQIAKVKLPMATEPAFHFKA
jgi:hypothetical protein